MLTALYRIGFTLLLLCSFAVSAQTLSLKADAPKRYEVQRGDSLWSVAQKFLQDPWMWPQLWQANPHVSNPHLLYPGDVLELLEGENILRIQPRLRIMALQEPIPFMPLHQLEAFLNRDLMIDRPEFEDALYVVGLSEGRTMAAKGDQLNVLGDMTEGVTRYGIYRELEEVRHPVTRKHLGFKAQSLGTARLISDDDKMSVFEITNSYQEIRVGDRLLPFSESPFGDGFQPALPANPLHGKLLRALANDQTLIGSLQPVMLDMGSDQLQPGHLLEVLAPGRRLRNPATGEVIFAAENRKGLVMVYRVFDHTSFGLVMHAREPLVPGDVFRQADKSHIMR
ncbi:MAG: LysM peptidoglycan-binding domain-containing protein [Marinospirillum sp.]|uniref:LysM peptidoglycan-binding domain-containing protein n=1 Tax=Marinospirillum sp. TaxID=2183934 RepID=UPI001A0E42AF|nr:LysM domain-containing protein [Marinospirillum sp.]MBE0506668.1 LysM peptidoglycan-binding domain-containing protein [Marinospirillum sp.]